jgi:hypothetical protein
MSKPAPVHADSPRPRSPASALFTALRRLTASRAALPVHGVSTTPATTPQLPSADKASQLRPSSAPRSPATRHLGHELRVSGLAPITRQGHISQCPCVQPPRSNRSERPTDSYRHRGRPYLPILGVLGFCARYACGRLSRGRRASGGVSAGSSLKGRPATSGASATGRTRSGYRSHRPDGQTRCP